MLIEFILCLVSVLEFIIPLDYLFPNQRRTLWISVLCTLGATVSIWLITTHLLDSSFVEFLLFATFFVFIALNYKRINIGMIVVFGVLHLMTFLCTIAIHVMMTFLPVNELTRSVYLYMFLDQLFKLLSFTATTIYFKQLFAEYGQLNLRRVAWVMLPIGVMMLLILEGYFIYSDSNFYSVIILSSVIVVVYLFKIIKKQFLIEDKQQNMAIYNKIIDASNDQYLIIQQKAKEIRMIKHDMLNKLAIIQTLVHEDKKSEVMKYMEQLIGDIENESYFVLTDYQYINAILNYKINQFPDIRFNVLLDIKSINDSIEFDICTIVSNLIDNAIDEINRSNFKKTFINLNVKQNASMLLIKCENQLSGVKTLNTEKDDSTNHGLGLKIIENIINKHDGEMIIDQTDLFSVRILLQLRQ